MKRILENIFNFFFPHLCPLCEKEIEKDEIICNECFEETMRSLIKEPFCRKCGKEKKYNHKCEKKFEFDEIISIFHYRGKILDLIHNYKYKRIKKISKILIPLLKERIEKIDEKFDLILSVPLHPARKRERGFDQNEIFCREISERLKIPYIKDGIFRIKYTKPQAKIKDEKERMNNIKGVFKTKIDFKDKKVIIFDDVVTTGATLNEISNLLKERGVMKILALTIAIA
ncbi:MAG: ComF family protein [candidate division WOR-3 bacterium]